MFEELAGNPSLKSDLAAAIAAGRLPHGILLCGEEGLGAGFASRLLAAQLVAGQDTRRRQRILAGEGDSECVVLTGEGAAGQIKVKTLLEERGRVQKSVLSGAARAFVIPEAENLNPSSANALLKVLEEPPSDTYFILAAPSRGSVLPTVLSRCVVHTLAPVPPGEAKAFLAKSLPKGTSPDSLLSLFGGRLGLCLRYGAGGKKKKNLLAKALALAAHIAGGDRYQLLVGLTADVPEREEAEEVLRLLRYIALAALQGRPAQGAHLTADQAETVLQEAQEALLAIASNINRKLLLSRFAQRCTPSTL